MQNVGLILILTAVLALSTGLGLYFVVTRIEFRRTWSHLRKLRHERLTRISKILNSAFEGAKLDPFRHLPKPWAEPWVAASLKFASLEISPDSCPPEDIEQCPSEANSFFLAIRKWEDHHHTISRDFLDALGHVALRQLAPDSYRDVQPVGNLLIRLVGECPEPVLLQELRTAQLGLETAARQNLEYVSRRLREAARETHSAFHMALSNADSEVSRIREGLIHSICDEAENEIAHWLKSNRGVRLNPLSWGRQVACLREFEQLRSELGHARSSGDLSHAALVVGMIMEDGERVVRHIHVAIRSHDELHQKLSSELQTSAECLRKEADLLTGWVIQENQRLESSVSHQLIRHLERWQAGKTRNHRISKWIEQLSALRDQDPELASQAA